MARDYYEVLGVPRTADKDRHQTGLSQLARQYHPDVSNHPTPKRASRKSTKPTKCFPTMTNAPAMTASATPGCRVRGPAASAVSPALTKSSRSSSAGFGGARSASTRRGPRPAQDRKVDVTITFEESVFGVDKEIEIDRMDICETCNGSWRGTGHHPHALSDSAAARAVCARCSRHSWGRWCVSPPARAAMAAAKSSATACQHLPGRRPVRGASSRSVQIPPGVREGLQMQVRGEGDAGEARRARGNLYVVIHVRRTRLLQAAQQRHHSRHQRECGPGRPGRCHSCAYR
jgi:molecular chaperone DnaJ